MILNNILTYKNSTRNRSVDKARTTTLKIFYRNHSNSPPPQGSISVEDPLSPLGCRRSVIGERRDEVEEAGGGGGEVYLAILMGSLV